MTCNFAQAIKMIPANARLSLRLNGSIYNQEYILKYSILQFLRKQDRKHRQNGMFEEESVIYPDKEDIKHWFPFIMKDYLKQHIGVGYKLAEIFGHKLDEETRYVKFNGKYHVIE